MAKKKYIFNFKMVLSELERIKTSYNENFEKYKSAEKLEYYDDIFDTLSEPVLITGWLTYPIDFRDYLISNDVDIIFPAVQTLAFLSNFTGDVINFEFPDLSEIPDELYPKRVYGSFVKIVQNTFGEHSDVDGFYSLLEDILDDLVIFINDKEETNINYWNIALFLEFLNILPILRDISKNSILDKYDQLVMIANRDNDKMVHGILMDYSEQLKNSDLMTE